jgi:O-antigen ligase
MARLAHNDYLQQGSDSGLVSLLAYGLWFMGGLFMLYRNRDRSLVFRVVWLGLVAVAGQGVVEFGGYVPAVGWLTFFLMGWLGGGANAIDKRVESS